MHKHGYYLSVKAGANVRVRVSGAVIRVEVGEPGIGAVIRITANLEPVTIATFIITQNISGSFLPS